MHLFLHRVDVHILRLINDVWAGPAFDDFMRGISNFDYYKIPLAIAVVILLIFGRFRERAFFLMMALCLLIGDGGIDLSLKHLANRPRPKDGLQYTRVVDGDGVHYNGPPSPNQGGRSFPSSHAANNAALALMATYFYGRWAWFLWPWAALVGYSRIYVGAHYPSDVIAGWLLGVGYAWLILKICQWFWRHLGPRYCPRLYAAYPRIVFRRRR